MHPDTSVDRFPQSRSYQKKTYQRDSLASREQIGRPGSKRYQRWFNGNFLSEQADTLKTRLDFQVVEDTSLFRCLFVNADSAQLWEPFCEVTEDEQDEMLIQLGYYPKPTNDGISTLPHRLCSAQTSFKKIDKRIRAIFDRNFDCDLLQKLDQEIIAYVHRNDSRKRVYVFKQPFHRLICHGVAQFYSLRASSQDTSQGQRELVISKPPRVILPSKTLCEYLKVQPVQSC